MGLLLRAGVSERLHTSVQIASVGTTVDVLIQPLGEDEPASWLIFVGDAVTSWTESDLATIEYIGCEIQDYLTSGPEAAGQALQDLVADVAETLMSVEASGHDAAMASLVEQLGHFFAVDVVFLRRNDHDIRASIMVAEWPTRTDVPDPDPLAVVPFDSDPSWSIGEHLTEPFVMRPQRTSDSYKTRVEESSGVGAVTSATVPLLSAGTTTGVLGCVKFGDRPWSHEEIGALRAVAALVVQFQARIAAENSKTYLNDHDGLTGLLYRDAFLDQVEARLGTGDPFGIITIELDRFDAVSESFGSDVADRIVTAAADRLVTTIRNVDSVARIGNARFAIVMDALSAMELSAVAMRSLEVLRVPIDINGHGVVRTASAGVHFQEATGSGHNGASHVAAAELLRQSIVAMGAAREHGGDRYELVGEDSSSGANKADRLIDEALLRRAVVREELEVHYQPEINLVDGSVLGAEALVRWNHPGKGLLAAGAFIDLAEESGLIVDLGWWVLTEACHQTAVWLEQGIVQHPFEIRVNLAAAQLASDEVVNRVRDALKSNGLAPSSLCLEITETSVMADYEVSKGVLSSLRDIGVRLAVDDFGTGFSSMSYIRDLPVQIVKIDQTFVNGLGERPADEAIVDSMVQLGLALGLDVVAEGIEEPVHWERLRSMGCTRAQGFYMARPASAADIENVLQQGVSELVPKRTLPQPIA